MKVRIALTVELDANSWRLNYGEGMTESDIREDVNAYVRNVLASCPVPMVEK